MDGFVVTLKQDNSPLGQIGYWAGNSITESLDDALFLPDIVVARQTAGTLQNQFTDRTVLVAPVTKGIQLTNVVSSSLP